MDTNRSFTTEAMLTDTDDVTSHINLVFSPIGSFFFFGIFTIVSIGSVVGNLLVIIAFKNDKYLRRRPTNIFLVSLAFTDFLTGLIAIPFYSIARGIESDFTCSGHTRYFLFFPGMLCGVSSVTHLTLIAVDRYIAISRPLTYPLIATKKRCVIIILAGGAFSVLACAWPAFSMDPEESFCGDLKKTTVVNVFVIALSVIIILYFGIMIFCHLCMIRTALKHVRLRRTLSTSAKPEQSGVEDARSRLRATVTVAIIMGAFVVCWAPITFKFWYQSFFTYSNRTFLIVQVTCELPFYANSMINPIIYGYRNAQFRLGYKNALHGCVPCLVKKPLVRPFSFPSRQRPSYV